MAIVTRCPACATVFRVQPEQLKAHNGAVRCGRCMTVFDGFRTLSNVPEPGAAELSATGGAAGNAVPEPETAVPEVAASPVPAPAAAGDLRPAPSPPAAAAPPPVEPTPAPRPAEPAFRLEAVSATELAAAAAGAPPAKSDAADEGRDFGPAPEQLTLEDHLFLDENREARVRVARLWAGAAALGLIALAVQIAYFYRGEIAARYPGARTQLARLCELTGCGIYLPQRPQLIVIEATDLQATDPARPAVIQLTATVRNHATYDLGLPALDLVLTNSRDHTLARRIFQPREYLEPGRDPLAGIPAKGEMTINLELDTADLRPAGFRLDLMVAQQP